MNPNRYGYLLLLLSLLVSCLACGERGSVSNSPAGQLTAPPYNNAEPQKYQAEVWQTHGAVTDRYLVATDGAKWRVDSAYGDPAQVTTLHADRDYVIAVGAKTYAEVPETHGYETKRDEMVREISYGLLNSDRPASYQKLESTQGTVTYKVSPDPKEGSESIVTIDQTIGLPVKKQIFSGSAGSGTPVITISITNLSMSVDPTLFDIPKDFKKVPIQDMKSVLTGQK